MFELKFGFEKVVESDGIYDDNINKYRCFIWVFIVT